MKTSQSSQRYELRFRSLFNEGRGYAFPCDAHGQVETRARSWAASSRPPPRKRATSTKCQPRQGPHLDSAQGAARSSSYC